MVDCNDIRGRGSSCLVGFRNIPYGSQHGAIYIENEYHKKFNRYLRRWGWWLRWRIFDRHEYGDVKLTYIPSFSQKKMKRLLQYQYPFLPKEATKKLSRIKTVELLDYLEDPDDARFLKPGFLFYKEEKGNGISVYSYYPLAGLDIKCLTYRTQIVEILEAYKEDRKEYCSFSSGHIGESHGFFCKEFEHNENYADNMFESLDYETRCKLQLFKKHVIELREFGIPLAVMEKIIHESDKLSKLVITKKYEVILPDYNNMVVKMEPLVKAVYLLFLKHPEGIVFKYLSDYRQELIDIYKDLRPMGLNSRSLQSIEDVTNPCLNSINEKCARIRAAFINKFDEHLAKNYIITGQRGEAKKIALPRELVVWE